jgi:hypothetical protein
LKPDDGAGWIVLPAAGVCKSEAAGANQASDSAHEPAVIVDDIEVAINAHSASAAAPGVAIVGAAPPQHYRVRHLERDPQFG